MDTKTVYQLDELGRYVGKTVADRSPLETDVWLIPSGCVTQAPPRITAGKFAEWDGLAWHLVELNP